jgi:hypothetical protein
MIRTPSGVIDGMSLHYYHQGGAYEVPTALAEYLVAEGYAAVEMRRLQRSSRIRHGDRRRPPARASEFDSG